jgi:hypothetical protein
MGLCHWNVSYRAFEEHAKRNLSGVCLRHADAAADSAFAGGRLSLVV